MIRKELPRCSAEEAHNALEACLKDVNFAIASLSQVPPPPCLCSSVHAAPSLLCTCTPLLSASEPVWVPLWEFWLLDHSTDHHTCPTPFDTEQ